MLSKHDYGIAGRASRRDRLEYRLVWSLCFVTYFVAAIFRRAAALTHGGAKKRESILAEARAAAHAAAGYAFLS